MFSICANYIRVGEDLFKVVKVYAEDRILNIDLVKTWLGADSVFRKDGALYYCTKIEEAQIINE